MRRYGRTFKTLVLTGILTLLMAGAALAANVTSRTYTLSARGYIGWSDFRLTQEDTVSVNMTTSTVNGAGLTRRTLDALFYQIQDLQTGKILYTYSRNGMLRYTQVRSTASQVYDTFSVKLPAGSYRLKVTDTEAVRQPVHVTYNAKDTKASPDELKATSQVRVTAGQMIQLPIRDQNGRVVTVTGASSYDGEDLDISWSGSSVTIRTEGAKPGTYHVTVTAAYGSTYLSKVLTIQVDADDSKAKINASTMTLKVKQTAKNFVDNASWASSVKWTSYNTKIVTVKRSGKYVLVTGVKPGTTTVTGTYKKRVFGFKVTVEEDQPELQIYAKRISGNRKYLYLRVRNKGSKAATFYSAGAALYTMTGTNNNAYTGSKISKLKLTKGKKVSVSPGKWTTLTLRRTRGKFQTKDLKKLEVQIRFHYASVRYTAAVEDSYLDSQYRLTKKGSVWYPAYSARNNFSGKTAVG